MAQTILLPFDGSEPAERALHTAASAFVEPEITVIYVVDPLDSLSATGMEGPTITSMQHQREEAGEQRLEEAEGILASYDVAVDTMLRVGDVTREVVRAAEEGEIDHIVIGSHGRSGIDRFLLGSVAEKVVRRSPVPVTVVR